MLLVLSLTGSLMRLFLSLTFVTASMTRPQKRAQYVAKARPNWKSVRWYSARHMSLLINLE